MRSKFVTITKQLLHSIGLDIHSYSATSSPSAQLSTVLSYIDANIIFDVGANVGQFAQEIRLSGFDGNIVSFDPLTEAHAKLIDNARNDSKWIIHPRIALGDCEGEIEINISNNSASSSVLEMLDAHSFAAPKSSYVASESTPLVRLDSVSNQYLRTDSVLFIKIDTQGYEWQVLDGATETLKRAQGVMLELSLIPLYRGQRLWREIIERMEREGFTLWAIQKGLTDASTGRSLQIDGIFLRK